MGFLTNILGKSLFTEDSYRGALGKSDEEAGYIGGYSSIVIQPVINRLSVSDLDPIIVGIIKEQPQYNYVANWTDMGGIASILPGIPFVEKIGDAVTNVGRIGNIAGAADMGAVYQSKKLYHKSGYLEISPEFRVVDWKGTGDPLRTAFFMASYCVPVLNDQDLINLFSEFIKNLKDMDNTDHQILANTINLFQRTYALGESAVNWLLSVAETNLDKTKVGKDVVQATKNIYKTISQDVREDYLTFRSAPTPVKINIGKYFFHSDMVIINVGIRFSEQMTKRGPLYADISTTMSSRKIMGDPSDIGFVTNKGRYQIIDAALGEATRNHA